MLVSFTWLFFRAESVSAAFEMVKNIFTKINPWVLYDQSLYTLGLDLTEVHILMVALVLLILVDCVRFFKGQTIEKFLNEQCSYLFKILCLFVLSCL